MYAPFYIKTSNSLLHSMIKIDSLIEYAIENNIEALTITDDNMYGVMEFYQKCKKNNIKPIIGLEVTINEQKIVLYAKNNLGYKNLLKINNNVSNIEIIELSKYADSLICIVPNESIKLFSELSKIFSDIYVSYTNEKEKNEINARKIYMRETLYLTKDERNYLKYLHAIKKGVTFEEITSYKGEYNLEIVFEEENKNIVSMCNVELEFNKSLLPVFPCPDNMDSFSYLKKLCKEGLRKIFGDYVLKVYIERLKYELDIINKMGFSNYFLVVHDYIDYAKENNILVGPGRGSAAGSLVAYALNITTIDPIKYNLLFERFLNPARITMPDIDIDFEDTRRDEVINYCVNKYGIKRVAPIITFGTLASKQVIRDVARTMNIDTKVVDQLVKMLNPSISIYDNYKSNNGIKNFINKREDLKNLYRVATKFEGLKRHTSIHAAGIVIANCDLDEVIPLDHKHEFYTTAYSMEYLEEIGLLKMDFLGLKNLTLITNILNSIEKKLDFDSIPLDDKEALDIFTNVNTLGIFQFESAGMINFLKKFKPTTFEDIFAAIALFRPGPMDNIDSYIKRKHGLEKIDYFHDDLKPVLENTYGIVVYQEQIMQIANIMGGYSYGEADVLRKAMSKKKEAVLLKEKEIFVKRSVERGYREEIAVKVYDMVLKFASYGFNRAHSVAYAMISYRMAYLKAHFPTHFMNALLTNASGSEIKLKEYIAECKRLDIKVLGPSINSSYLNFKVQNNALRFPLTSIKGIGIQTVNAILNEREKGQFKDIYDFLKRVYGKNCNRKILESLIFAGVFDEFKINRKTLIDNLDIIINYGEVIKDLDSNYSLKPVLKNTKEYDIKEILSKEVEILGLYLSDHPLSKIKLEYKNIIDLIKIDDYFDKTVNILVIVDSVRETTTKSGEKMAFLNISDEFRKGEAVLFPSIYERVNVGGIYYIEGKVEKRFSKYQIVVSNIKEKII